MQSATPALEKQGGPAPENKSPRPDAGSQREANKKRPQKDKSAFLGVFKVMKDFIKRTSDPNLGDLTYSEARQFLSNAGQRLSTADR